MKISSVRTRLACPARLADPVLEPTAAAMANFVTVEVRTDEHLEGIGYAGFVRPAMLKPLRLTLDALGELALGEDPFAVESVSAKLLEAGGLGAPAGLVTRAAAALDVALWDIKGKAAGLPLYRLLGGGSNRAPAYASGYLWRDYNADRLAAKGAELVDQGFRAMKFRMGGEATGEADIHRLNAICAAVEDAADLMVDINQGWSLERALRLGREIEASGLYWLEDPIHHQDYAGLAQLAHKLDLPIATGEYHYGLPPLQQLLEHRAADILMVDLLRVGGITHWMKAAHLAEAFNRPIVSHLAPEILAHCVAAAPNGLIVEHMPWALPLFQESFVMEEGDIVLPDKPGLGLEFDADTVARLAPDT